MSARSADLRLPFPRGRHPRRRHAGRGDGPGPRRPRAAPCSSTAPCSGGSRNVPASDPSSSNRQVSRRRIVRRRVVGVADLAVGAGEPLQLVPGHRPGDLGQAPLGVRGGDPGQRPHLSVGEPGRGELVADHRQVPQRPRHPDVFPGGAGGHLALPRQPLRAAVHLPAGPAAARVEVGQQDQEPARGRGQVPGQLADLRLQPLQRHRTRRTGIRGHGGGELVAGRGRGRGGGAGLAGGGPGGARVGGRLSCVEHEFDVSVRV